MKPLPQRVIDWGPTAPVTGDLLVWNGSAWVPGKPRTLLLEVGQGAANVPSGTPVGTLIFVKGE